MATRIKVDEDLPQAVAERLRAAGHDAFTVVEEDLSGASDDRVWEAAHSERRCLFTADKGFADARKYPPGTHDGIVLFRLPRESRLGYIRLLESLLAERELESLAGAIVTVSPDAIRVRRAEQGEV